MSTMVDTLCKTPNSAVVSRRWTHPRGIAGDTWRRGGYKAVVRHRMTNALHGRSLNCAGGRTAIVAALRQAADLLSRSILSDADNNAANSVDSEGLAVARMLSCIAETIFAISVLVMGWILSLLCVLVCLFGTYLLRNCWMVFAEIVHRVGDLFRTLRLIFWVRHGSRKCCFLGLTLDSASLWQLLLCVR